MHIFEHSQTERFYRVDSVYLYPHDHFLSYVQRNLSIPHDGLSTNYSGIHDFIGDSTERDSTLKRPKKHYKDSLDLYYYQCGNYFDIYQKAQVDLVEQRKIKAHWISGCSSEINAPPIIVPY